MRRSTLFLCLLVTPCFLAFSAAMPDFSGTWIRDVGRSDPMSTLIEGKVITISADLVIKHAENNLQIETRWDYKEPTTENYILDGSENHSRDEKGNSTTYVASWKEGELTIYRLRKVGTPFGSAETKDTSHWSLSDGGNTLTVTTNTEGSSFASTRKQVYHR